MMMVAGKQLQVYFFEKTTNLNQKTVLLVSRALKYAKKVLHIFDYVIHRARPDTLFCRTGPVGPDWIRTYISEHFTIKINKKKYFKQKKIFFNFFFLVLRLWSPGRKKTSSVESGHLKIYRTSDPDVMSGWALVFHVYLINE